MICLRGLCVVTRNVNLRSEEMDRTAGVRVKMSERVDRKVLKRLGNL